MRPWIKLYTHRLDDVRLLRLDERRQLRYYQLYMLAGKLNADGCFVENGTKLNDADIALKLRIRDLRQFQSDMKALRDAGLIHVNGRGPAIKDFAGEQVDWSRKQEQDRERQARHRDHEPVTRDRNVTDKPSRVSHASRPDQTKIKKKTKKKKEIKTTTTQPSSSKSEGQGKSRFGGGGTGKEKKNDQEFINQLRPEARKTAAVMIPILRSSGLGQSKIETLMNIVAIRIDPERAKQKVLAALASVYADDSVRNKPMVAYHRIEHDQIPSQFYNSTTWNKIPADVLEAAGENKLQSKVAALRNRSEQEDE